MFLFTGVTAYDFKVDVTNGALWLNGANGIVLNSPMAGDIAMGGYKATNLGAPVAHTDAARYENAIEVVTSTTRPALPYEGQHIYETDTDKTMKWTGAAWVEVASGVTDHGALTGLLDDDHTQYLLLTAGSARELSGDLYIDKTTPSVVLQHSGVTKGYVQATATEFDVYPSGVKMALGDSTQITEAYGSSILLRTGATPATRMTIADNDTRSASHFYPSVTDTLNLGSGASNLWWSYVYAQRYHIDDANTYIDNNTGNMRFTVATGKKFEFVVS